MSHRVVKHTADIRLFVEAETREELFAEALASLMELLHQKPQSVPVTIKREIKLTAPDLTVLLVDFLSDCLTHAHTNKEVYSKFEIKLLTDTKVSGELIGGKVDQFEEDVKAVTYHEAEVKKNDAGKWETTLVLDI